MDGNPALILSLQLPTPRKQEKMSIGGSATFRQTPILLPSPAICHIRGAGAGQPRHPQSPAAGTKARCALIIAVCAAGRPARLMQVCWVCGDLHTDGPSGHHRHHLPPHAAERARSPFRSVLGFDCSPARERGLILPALNSQSFKGSL